MVMLSLIAQAKSRFLVYNLRVSHRCDAFSHQVKDCSLPILGDVFFIILILWGSFFTLNLLLAVLEGNFTKGKEDDKVMSLKFTGDDICSCRHEAAVDPI